MRQEHSAAAVACEAQFIKDLTHVHVFLWLSVLVTFAHHFTELVPTMSNDLPATEATHWNYHVEAKYENIINFIVIEIIIPIILQHLKK